MNGNFRNFAIWLVILFMLMGLFQVFQSSTRSVSVSPRSDVAAVLFREASLRVMSMVRLALSWTT